MSISEKIGLNKEVWVIYSNRISILFYVIFIVILWSLTEWFNFDILLISLPFGLLCVGVIWILTFVIILVFKAKKIPIEYREYDYLKRLTILMPVLIFVLLFLLNLNLPFIQNSFNETFEDSNDRTDTLNTYIENNVKCAVYIGSWGSEWNSYRYKHQIIIYILNNGTENIHKSLQININCYSGKQFSIVKPEDNLNLSYFFDAIKPWIFGDDYSVGIRWNESYVGSTLAKNNSRWAIIYCYTEDLLYGEEYQILYFSVSIDDRYDIDVIKMPIFVDPPEENPRDWDITEILEDIERYG